MQQNNPSPSTQSQCTRVSHHRLSTSSEEAEIDTQVRNNNDWQTMRSTKRNKTSSSRPAVSAPSTKTHNRYYILAHEVSQADSEGKPQPLPPQNQKPPPIFIHGVINYNQMVKSIREVAEDEQYFTKSMSQCHKANLLHPGNIPQHYEALQRKWDLFPHISTKGREGL
jgi:hypothetical protein